MMVGLTNRLKDEMMTNLTRSPFNIMNFQSEDGISERGTRRWRISQKKDEMIVRFSCTQAGLTGLEVGGEGRSPVWQFP